MKKLITATLTAVLLAACQQGGDSADFEELRADVDSMKLDIYGAEIGTCEESKIFKSIAPYKSSLDGLPSADMDLEAWHKANAERDNVMTTNSGLQYIVVQEGNADDPSPKPTDMVKVQYHGIFPDGKKFDSSYDRGRPSEFQANGVITGWVEALAGMKPCEARTLFVPGHLAYGPAGRPGIPSNATLMFHVQLLGIEKKGLIKK
ncbi:MAG: FKBP-type peptidyl-prolyl cis-trans isomerase [Hellea sp.]|nr:FKBP-type peptidyl-prolyl cis-trans isomerase [Hellea sp.]